MIRHWKLLAVLVLMVAVPWGGCQLITRAHHFSFVPEAMKASNLLYVSERSWGFGPGANESGLLVFEMPIEVAEGLEDGGIAYLESLPPNTGTGWQGKYTDWRETPVALDSQWGSSQNADNHMSRGIGDYLNRYGFSVPVEPEWEGLTNRALFAPGSFYAYGRIGLIILIPAERRIVYAYNG